MALPTVLYALLADDGYEVRHATPVTGGIHEAARVRTPDGGDFFVKWRFGGDSRPFECEAEGLRLLREPGVIAVPEVAAVRHRPAGAVSDHSVSYILMEYVEPTPVGDDASFRGRFAAELVALHRSGRSYGFYGLPTDNFLGHLPQPNRPRSDRWAQFYRDCRLLPQIRIARGRGHLNPERERLLVGVVERLPELLDGLPEEISLLHGDLWSGNFICGAGDTPHLIDPAAYFGHREVELAYVELFGGFPAGFVDAYRQVWPLAEGYERRRWLHQLYPLLAHLNHFGEQYGHLVERACREYAA